MIRPLRKIIKCPELIPGSGYKRLKNLKSHIDKEGKLPSVQSKDKKEVSNYQWFNKQRKLFKEKIKIMTNEEIYQAWHSFITHDKYKKLFVDGDHVDRWMKSFNFAVNYITKHNRLPSQSSNNKAYKKSGGWIADQRRNTFKHNKKLKLLWQNFINQPKYYPLFLNKVQKWKFHFTELNNYINKYKRFPPSKHELNKWYYYTKRMLTKDVGVISENTECNKLWHDFINNKQIIHPRPNIRKNINR